MRIIAVMLFASALCRAFAPVPGEQPGHGYVPPVLPCISLRYSTPVKISAAFGLTFLRRMENGSYDGVYFQLEPGFGGGKVNVGYKYGEYRFTPALRASLGTSILFTWGSPLSGVERAQTYVGIEGAIGYFVLELSGGVFRRTAGYGHGDDWIYNIGAGIGI